LKHISDHKLISNPMAEEKHHHHHHFGHHKDNEEDEIRQQPSYDKSYDDTNYAASDQKPYLRSAGDYGGGGGDYDYNNSSAYVEKKPTAADY
ncbi:hypothetical protein, partial [Klebsiella pneumoniae]|uniref:hypothetical protein n=1 Tax=Klebsiella pneumoniae TaxID=573 RepID=UPI001330C924